ncbi:MAG: hypothetical protein J7623_08205 [Chitinophaga sp.]|uniref:hypothetical protein n=1 Tax=Chitinophaga sp. TaxID=1869181 RepID=UPI001B13E584|nr:hypothetical protein [Chitinophaga sp.]MBO9728603.1 hypothetical protein [Chitinophaga sp.]
MQNSELNQYKHSVFVADHEGIDIGFPEIVELLKYVPPSSMHISLLYISKSADFIFRRELKVLAKRFPATFIAYYNRMLQQETIEMIINTNTKPEIEFFLSVNEELQVTILDKLQFLNIDIENIHFLNARNF